MAGQWNFSKEFYAAHFRDWVCLVLYESLLKPYDE